LKRKQYVTGFWRFVQLRIAHPGCDNKDGKRRLSTNKDVTKEELVALQESTFCHLAG
jgi:hypothetical protein